MTAPVAFTPELRAALLAARARGWSWRTTAQHLGVSVKTARTWGETIGEPVVPQRRHLWRRGSALTDRDRAVYGMLVFYGQQDFCPEIGWVADRLGWPLLAAWHSVQRLIALGLVERRSRRERWIDWARAPRREAEV